LRTTRKNNDNSDKKSLYFYIHSQKIQRNEGAMQELIKNINNLTI